MSSQRPQLGVGRAGGDHRKRRVLVAQTRRIVRDSSWT
nr:hypothetical protein [Kibdelosporangium sp. MJ126-NF4]CTQ98153.1 hypothetical protein [Kibdelosporangium sp. MJ126-NF4]